MRISDWSSDVCSSDLLHPPVNDAIGLCGQSGSKAHLTEEGTATAAPYSSDEISRHANRSELVDSALDFALQLLAFAFHFLRFSFAAYRSEEHTSELQSLMRISYAVFCLTKQNNKSEKTSNNISNHKSLTVL